MLAVIGRDGEIDDNVRKICYNIGRDIAKADCILICGGMNGVMEGACRGAVENNGLTIGILPTGNKEDANEYVQISIATGIGFARNAIITSAADGIIAINGRHGTLSEIGYALGYNKPVVLVEGSKGVCDDVDFSKAKFENLYKADAEDAVNLVINLIENRIVK
ncbi:MAG: TIGR00725 family protein [Candidatus Altiarchaeales archaeon HGW-Altiarchaeales-2]|nr:MAG: TIGR00725 family protein [Candidatus Altiarchaeales archaeon HGW-Altiarchaeales-2]